MFEQNRFVEMYVGPKKTVEKFAALFFSLNNEQKLKTLKAFTYIFLMTCCCTFQNYDIILRYFSSV